MRDHALTALLVGDIHLSDRPPSIRTESYAEDILAKLEFCVLAATNNGCDVMVLLGDVFHIKTPSRTSHALVKRTAEILDRFERRVLIVPGNHDMSQDRIESLPSQPLGTLALSPNITLLHGHDPQTGIYGIPYLHSRTDFEDELRVARATRATLIATHASIFPPGDHPPYEHIPADEIDTGNIPLAYGHIHDPHGFYRIGMSWFCNNGAISRGSLHEQTVKRQPRITLFEEPETGWYEEPTGECPFASIEVPHRPAEEVFRLAEHREEQARAQRLDDFLTRVDRVSLTGLSIEQILADAEASDLSPAARAELAIIVEETL